MNENGKSNFNNTQNRSYNYKGTDRFKSDRDNNSRNNNSDIFSTSGGLKSNYVGDRKKESENKSDTFRFVAPSGEGYSAQRREYGARSDLNSFSGKNGMNTTYDSKPYETKSTFYGNTQSTGYRQGTKPTENNGTAEKESRTRVLTPREEKKKLKENELLKRYFRKNKNSGKSKDELRKEYAIHAKKKRKRKVIETFILTLILFAGIIAALSVTVLFGIKTITVTGDTRYSSQQIIEASGIKEGSNLFRASASVLTEKATSKLPYVSKISIKRKLPDEIILFVSDSKPAYAVKTGNNYVLIDSEDKVIEASASKLNGAILLEGMEAKKADICESFVPVSDEDYQSAKMIAEIAYEKEIKLTEIDISDRNHVTAIYKSRVMLEFGALTDIERKLSMAKVITKELEDEGNTRQGIINLKGTTKTYFSEEPLPKKYESAKKSKAKTKKAEKNKTETNADKAQDNSSSNTDTAKTGNG